MNINIEFFNGKLIDSIKGGVYRISVRNKNRTKSLYIGESFSIIIRCATHLYSLQNNPNYFGFTSDTIENQEYTLIFEILKLEANTSQRKKYEKSFISQYNPILQSGISDRMKSIDEKIQSLEAFLNS